MKGRIATALRLGLAVGGIAAIGLFRASPADAQLAENLGGMTPENAVKYLAPLPDAFSGSMNSAIFTTGHVPVTGFTFGIGLKVMGVSLSNLDRLYTPTDPPGFTSVPPVQQAPTVIGGTSAVAQGGQGGATAYYPGGFDVGEFAFAAPQLSIGSVLGTRAVVRWFAYNFGARNAISEVDYYGVGAQHSITQYFTTLPIDLALGLFYQRLKINKDLIDAQSYHLDLTVSKSFRVLQPYAAIGYDAFTMDVLYEDDTNPGTNIAVDFDRAENVHLTAGVVAKLGFAQFHAEGNIAATTGVAVGLTFGK